MFSLNYSTNPTYASGFEIEGNLDEDKLNHLLNLPNVANEEKIRRLDEVVHEMDPNIKKQYHNWRFQHDSKTAEKFIEKQKSEIQLLIRQQLASNPSLDEFFKAMTIMSPVFTDKPAFNDWAKNEGLLDGQMQIFVNNITGRTITLTVNKDDTIEKLKLLIFDREGIPVDETRLIYGGKQLENNMTLKDYCIASMSTIQMTGRMTGG